MEMLHGNVKGASYYLRQVLQSTIFFYYNSIEFTLALGFLNWLDLPNSCYGYNSPPKSLEGTPVKSARKLFWIMRRVLQYVKKQTYDNQKDLESLVSIMLYF